MTPSSLGPQRWRPWPLGRVAGLVSLPIAFLCVFAFTRQDMKPLGPGPAGAPSGATTARAHPSETYGALPLAFEANHGQTDGRVKTTAIPLQPTKSVSFDAFVAKLNPAGDTLLAATYLGGKGSFDEARAIAVDGLGHVYVAGLTSSGDFPIMNGFQLARNGSTNFRTRLRRSLTPRDGGST